MEKIISFAACCLMALLLSDTARAQNTDIRWLRSINVGRNTSFDKPMNIITKSTYPISVALPVGELLVGYIKHDKNLIANGWTSAAALGGTVVITYGLKYAVNRTRPYLAYPDIEPYRYAHDASFPSGHTSIAFSTATSLSMQCPKWYIIAPAYLWAGTIGYSRMHLGMHYPSDVFVGAVVGSGSAFLAHKGQQWLQKRKHKKVVEPSQF